MRRLSRVAAVMTAPGSTSTSIRPPRGPGLAPERPSAAPGLEWLARSCLLVRPDPHARCLVAPQREGADAAAAADAHADRIVARLAEGDHAQRRALHEADLDQAQRHALVRGIERAVDARCMHAHAGHGAA